MSRELDEIRATAGPYERYALRSRKRLLTALRKSDRQVAKIYNDAILRILREFRQGEQSTKALLVAINEDFDAQYLFKDLVAELEDAVKAGAAAGITFSQDVTTDILGRVGMAAEPSIRAFEFCRQRAVAAAYARTYKDGLHLSDRIWKTAESSRDAMRAIVTAGIGEDAVKVARALETYVKQGAAVTAAHFPGMMKRMGSRVPENIDYNALRLARTELTAAYGEATIGAAKASPAIKKVRWVLSNTHPRTDICDAYASGGDGHGVYDAKDCPLSPAHPNCLCTIQPAPEDPVKFAQRLKKWMADPSSQPDIEKWYGENYKKFEGKNGGSNVFAMRPSKSLLTPATEQQKKTLGNIRDRYKILPTMTASEREATIKTAGKEFLAEVKRDTVWKERAENVKRLTKECDEAARRAWKDYSEEAEKQWADVSTKLRAARAALPKDNARSFAAHLAKVRPVGVDEADLSTHLTSKSSKVRPVVAEAYRHYPKDWTEQSFARGTLATKKVARGYYYDYGKTIAISGYDSGEQLETAIHELGHRMEKTVPDLLQVEKAFYERRTAGEDLEWLGGGYDKKEKARRDKFISMYMGKDYNGYAYELVSMGFQYAYTDPLKLMKDEDMAEWVLGILALL